MTDILEREHEPLEPGREHEPLNLDNHPEVKAHLESQPLSWQNAHMLGLHYTNKGICPGNFIGMVWIGEGNSRTVLRVDSKFPKMDYMQMFAECYEHPYIGACMNECLHVWPEQEPMKMRSSHNFSPLVVMSFLRALNQLCIRHLRKNFERRRENFIGKVKGKISVSENLRQNIVRGRVDRIFCEYQSVSDDILENRILRAALERAARYVARDRLAEKYPVLQRWIHACRSHLQDVSVTHISRPQFAAARKRGVFVFYRDSLHYAKMVLLKFGFNPHEEILPNSQTQPYAINSEKLFERYAELDLWGRHSEVRTPGNVSGGDSNFDISVRPDFYVPRNGDKRPEIIDAKYKYFSRKNFNHPYNSRNDDVYQVVAYFHHKGMRKELKCSKDDDVRISLAYPSLGFVEGEPDKTASFHPDVHIDRILCPIIKKESD